MSLEPPYAAAPRVGQAFAVNNSSQSSFKFNTTYEYLLAKYSDNSVIYYIGNLDQSTGIQIPGSEPIDLPGGGGLSHVAFFNATPTTHVPDGRATAMLLGLSLLGLGALRRRLQA